MICLSEGFLCLVLSSWAICLASLSLALWVAFRSSCVDAQGHSSREENQQWQSIIYSYVSVFQILKDVIEQTFGVALVVFRIKISRIPCCAGFCVVPSLTQLDNSKETYIK